MPPVGAHFNSIQLRQTKLPPSPTDGSPEEAGVSDVNKGLPPVKRPPATWPKPSSHACRKCMPSENTTSENTERKPEVGTSNTQPSSAATTMAAFFAPATPVMTPDIATASKMTPEVTESPTTTDVTAVPVMTSDINIAPVMMPDLTEAPKMSVEVTEAPVVTSVPVMTLEVTAASRMTSDVTVVPVMTPDVTVVPVMTPDVTVGPVMTPDVTVVPVMTPDVTVVPVVMSDINVAPTMTPDLTEAPKMSVEVTVTSRMTPDVTVVPVMTPDVTVVPVMTPDVTVVPVVTPEVTVVPVMTPDVTVVPVMTPEVTVVPVMTPEVVAVPVMKPSGTAAPCNRDDLSVCSTDVQTSTPSASAIISIDHMTVTSSPPEARNSIMSDETPPPPSPSPSPSPPPPPPPPPLKGSVRKKSLNVNELSQVPEISVWNDIKKMSRKPLDINHMKKFISGHDELDAPHDLSNRIQEPLMDSCKSMRVDLLLRKFSKVDDVLMFVRNVNHAAFTNEQLKELSALAPDEKQVRRIKTRSEDSLSVTEKFLYKLVQIPHYDLRIHIMLSRATSPPQLRELLDRLLEYRDACRYLLCNESIKVFLCWVLQAVNDINNGNKEEKAFGLRIGSLNTILSTKAKTPERATLLHVLVADIRKNDPSALTFATHLSTKLKRALQHSSKNLRDDFQKIKEDKEVLTAAQRDVEACEEVSSHLKDVLSEICPLIHEVEEVFKGVDADFKSVAAYFCEDRNSTIDTFFGIFLKVCEDVQFEENRENNELQNRRGSVSCLASTRP